MPGLRKTEPGLLSIQHFGFFVLRRPLNSINRLSEFHQRAARCGFEEELKVEFACTYLQESIRLASGELYEKMLHWLNGEILSGHSELIRTFYKYFIRASTRCTPFGLFAGLAYGEISDATVLEFEPNARPLLKVTPDFRWQSRVSDMLFENQSLRANLPVKANSSLACVGGSYRYIERGGDNHYLSAFDDEATLRAVLSLVAKGIEYGQLTAQLSALGYLVDEVSVFVDDLVANDVLEFRDQPTVVGDSFPARMIRRLEQIPTLAELTGRLRDIQRLCEMRNSDLDRLGVMRGRMTELDESPAELRVDTFFEMNNNTLAENLVESLTESLAELSALHFGVERQDLASFKEAFCHKYDTQEVPLALVLDAQLGIGFKGDLDCLNPVGEAGINYKTNATSDVIQASNLWWQNYLISRYLKFASARAMEISLSPADLQQITELKPRSSNAALARSAYAFGSLLKRNGSGNPDETLFVLSACQGPSAINMLGRFAQGCPKLNAGISEIVAHEQQQWPEAILAELVYSPRSKVANVMTRPTLYDYEIEYLGNASVASDKIIEITDLMVSVRDGHIILRSKKWNKRVIPRLSNMHNHQHGLPVYRFLAALQSQDSSFSIGWDWGLFVNSEFLPRVRYKNVVISRATWKLRKSDFSSITGATVSSRLAAMEMPRQFVIAVGDNELFIDTQITQSLDLLLNHISKNEVTIIKEFLPDGYSSVLTNEVESVQNELVIPFRIRPDASYAKPVILPKNDVSNVTEQFEPGSEWVYVKVYGSEGLLDYLLREKMSSFANGLIDERVVEKFFFVRYKDPESHLRLRFLRCPHTTFEDLVGKIRALLAPELGQKLIAKIQLDTYQRELERYGGSSIELCESFFSADSVAIGMFLASGDSVRSVDERLAYAVKNVVMMAEAMGIGPGDLSELAVRGRDILLSEQGLPLSEMGRWHNLTRTFVREGLHIRRPGAHPGAGILADVARIMQEAESKNLFISLTHMSVNRLFREEQRYFEAVVFHMVHKISLARTKGQKSLSKDFQGAISIF